MMRAKELNLQQVSGWIALIVGSIILGKSVSNSDDLILFVIISAILATIVFADETVGIGILLAFSFYWNYIVDVVLIPSMFLNLVYVIIILLFLKMVTYNTVQRTRFVDTPINKASIVLFTFILTSMVLNHNPIPTALKGIIKHTFVLPLFFVVASSNLAESTVKKMIGSILAIGLLQIPASVIQYYFVYFDKLPGYRQDHSAGLLGLKSGAVNAVLMTFLFSIIFGLVICYGVRVQYALTASGLLVPIILSSARAGLIFFVITGIFLTILMAFMEGKRAGRSVRVGVLIVGLIAIAIVHGAREGQVRFVTDPSGFLIF